MTKAERIKHRQLVNELKSRQARGESNVIVHNGRIIKTNRSQSSEWTATNNMETSSGGSQENPFRVIPVQKIPLFIIMMIL